MKRYFKVYDPKLDSLVNSVPAVLKHARSESTNKKYEGYFKKWINWCKQFREISPMPTKEQYVVLFIVSCVQQDKSFSVIESTIMAIKYFHAISGHQFVQTSILKYALEAAKRLVGKEAKKKEPITVDMLKLMIKTLSARKDSLKALRLITILIVSFTGFLRFSECQNLRRSDLFFTTHAMIFIEKSKTDVYRHGHWLCLARLKSHFCPVRALESYCTKIKENSNSNNFIFRALTSKHKLRKANKAVSYSTIRNEFKAIVNVLGFDKRLYGLHSLRSGGVSTAANLGVKDRLLMKHGRWKSHNVKNRYISESIKSLLYVSRSLGL